MTYTHPGPLNDGAIIHQNPSAEDIARCSTRSRENQEGRFPRWARGLINNPMWSGIHPGHSITAFLDDGRVRRCYITGEPDTFFSIPARASIDGRKVKGFITSETVNGYDTATPDDPSIYRFHAYTG